MSKHARRIAKVSLNFLVGVALNRLLTHYFPGCPSLVVEVTVTALLELAPDALRALQQRLAAKRLAAEKRRALPAGKP